MKSLAKDLAIVILVQIQLACVLNVAEYICRASVPYMIFPRSIDTIITVLSLNFSLMGILSWTRVLLLVSCFQHSPSWWLSKSSLCLRGLPSCFARAVMWCSTLKPSCRTCPCLWADLSAGTIQYDMPDLTLQELSGVRGISYHCDPLGISGGWITSSIRRNKAKC